ncbi:HAMP domain-containing sensor histidine kinase [Cryptosporangium japonicum]|uniref:histidine kinase n=1 Tax=Cryptosporangium japonicum TaxID=80872 RepID=A0ABN0THU5_9ACTN
MSPTVPLHRSLLIRLVATSMLIAVCAVAATAWLTTELTRRAVVPEPSRALTADTDIYDALIGYAATHRTWAGVDGVLRTLAERTGRRIALTTPDRRPIAAAPADAITAVAVSSVPTAAVDPLNSDGGLIDPRAVGPYRLGASDRSALDRIAADQVACLAKVGYPAETVRTPSGRPVVQPADGRREEFCESWALDQPVGAERAPLAELTERVAVCAGEQKLFITPLFAVAYGSGAQLQSCLDAERRAQLRPWVAPIALVFVTGPAAPEPEPGVTLSRRNVLRIAGTTTLVFVVAAAATILVGRRLVRPLRLLTDAARRDARHPVPVTTRDEIGYLAAAFNDLAARRQAVERQRTEMVSDIAHELRTPLTNIRAWLESARDGVITVDAEVLEVLVEESILLHHVVDDLGDLAAADAGSLRVHREPIYVRDLLEQLVGVHQGGVRVVLEAAADPEVSVDPVRLRQIVGNLLSNAVRHTPPGGRVTVRLEVRPAQLEIAVTDTGSGIAPADLAKVFDRFWRADTSRTRATGGSGLGLAISRQLAHAHGGELTATSEPGHGSTFTLVLPI